MGSQPLERRHGVVQGEMPELRVQVELIGSSVRHSLTQGVARVIHRQSERADVDRRLVEPPEAQA